MFYKKLGWNTCTAASTTTTSSFLQRALSLTKFQVRTTVKKVFLAAGTLAFHKFKKFKSSGCSRL
jgi:hypothetical protein